MDRSDPRTANLLTFDIEGFIEASHDSMAVPSECISAERESEEIRVNTLEIVDVLAQAGQTGTFFILGRIARDMPALVREIASAGHEIGSGIYCFEAALARTGFRGVDIIRLPHSGICYIVTARV